jgi:ubiquinone/menaquinone biosynthesis C-methylase UbiE
MKVGRSTKGRGRKTGIEAMVSPTPLLAATFGFAITSVLVAAVELDLFTAISRGADTVERLSQETKCSPRGLRILLNALAGCGHLAKEKGRYLLTPFSAAYLSKRSRTYAGSLALHSRMLRDNWDHLAEVVRTGKIRHAAEGAGDRGEFFSEFVDSLYGLNTPAAEAVARQLWKGQPPSPCHVLDVGAGSAVWSLALAKRAPQVRVTVADWPTVIEKATKHFVAREKMEDRYSYLPGDFRETDFGESAFDLAYLGHVCHGEGAGGTRKLFGRLRRALKKGGRVVIADMLPDEERCQATFPLLFAVNMLVNTENGDTFTLGEYRHWLEASGFRQVRALNVPGPSPVIVAIKAHSKMHAIS